MKKINIAMAGWGTWGHVFPIESLIKHIYKTPKHYEKINKIVRFWKNKSLEKEVFLNLKKNYPWVVFQNITSWKYRRETWFSSKLKNIKDFFKFMFWIIQSIFYIIRHKIDVVFCKWWYVALPVVVAAKLLRRKIIVHESDARSWLVNKIASRYANKVFTGFAWVLPNSTTVWQILSEDIVTNQSIKNLPIEKEWQEEGRKLSVYEKLFYTDPSKTHLLIMWWSQGSKRLYQNILDSIQENHTIYKHYEIYLILWKENQDMRAEFDIFRNVHVFDFLTQKEMWLLLKYCDISLTRAGTTSLAEQKLYNLKIVMVPIPRTHDQYDNAKLYVNKYQDILLDSKDENYSNEMLKIFDKYKNFKKEDVKNDLVLQVSIAKDTIINSIINVKEKRGQ